MCTGRPILDLWGFFPFVKGVSFSLSSRATRVLSKPCSVQTTRDGKSQTETPITTKRSEEERSLRWRTYGRRRPEFLLHTTKYTHTSWVCCVCMHRKTPLIREGTQLRHTYTQKNGKTHTHYFPIHKTAAAVSLALRGRRTREGGFLMGIYRTALSTEKYGKGHFNTF